MASWFVTYVEHPFVAAIEGLSTNPAITGNAEAAAAVADAKKQATAVAASASTAVVAVISDAQTAEDPAISALGTGLTAAVDAYLTAALGPVGGEIAASAANAIIALGEARAHDLLTALFAHAASQVKTSA